MPQPPDRISLRSRIAWHVAFYALAVPIYVVLADGRGHFEGIMSLLILSWPVVAAIDVLLAVRRGKKV